MDTSSSATEQQQQQQYKLELAVGLVDWILLILEIEEKIKATMTEF